MIEDQVRLREELTGKSAGRSQAVVPKEDFRQCRSAWARWVQAYSREHLRLMKEERAEWIKSTHASLLWCDKQGNGHGKNHDHCNQKGVYRQQPLILSNHINHVIRFSKITRTFNNKCRQFAVPVSILLRLFRLIRTHTEGDLLVVFFFGEKSDRLREGCDRDS